MSNTAYKPPLSSTSPTHHLLQVQPWHSDSYEQMLTMELVYYRRTMWWVWSMILPHMLRSVTFIHTHTSMYYIDGISHWYSGTSGIFSPLEDVPTEALHGAVSTLPSHPPTLTHPPLTVSESRGPESVTEEKREPCAKASECLEHWGRDIHRRSDGGN